VPFSPGQLQAWSTASAASARVVLPLLFRLSRPASVVDVGCLFGAWAAAAGELGVADVTGVDGTYVDRSKLLLDRFEAHDLTVQFRLDREFDLALCLEVAHYLPRQRAASFVADLCALSPLVLFSAAIPHQGGLGHVNEQWPAYWAEHFVKRGYTPVDCVRDEIWDDPDVAPWYAQNTLLFVKHDAATAPLRAHYGYGRCPARVHPAVYMTYAGGRYHTLRRRANALRARAARR
jgi:SAM-dependent methyltransferase